MGFKRPLVRLQSLGPKIQIIIDGLDFLFRIDSRSNHAASSKFPRPLRRGNFFNPAALQRQAELQRNSDCSCWFDSGHSDLNSGSSSMVRIFYFVLIRDRSMQYPRKGRPSTDSYSIRHGDGSQSDQPRLCTTHIASIGQKTVPMSHRSMFLTLYVIKTSPYFCRKL